MRAFDFIIYLDAGDVSLDETERLYECGCDDGTVGKINGRWQIGFTRDADSMIQAVDSARNDVQSAGLKVAAVEIANDAWENVCG